MKAVTTCFDPRRIGRRGSMLFYVVGALALLGVFGLIAMQSATLESRSARNQLQRAQAAAHAEAGVRMVRIAVENRFVAGQTMAEALEDLEVSAPDGVEFDDIDTFRVVVPDRLFAFEVTGHSAGAEVTLAVQYRRKELLGAGIFGSTLLGTQPNIDIYGYDSRTVSSPTVYDSNGSATVGSNTLVDFGNNLNLDGHLVLGADEFGVPAVCEGCYGLETIDTGHIDPDPLGINNGGLLSQRFELVRVTNDNDSNPAISNNQLDLSPGDSVTFESGDYYFTEVSTPPNTEILIDNTGGPVRFFVDGEVYFAPVNGLPLNDPFGFQIYSSSSEDFQIQPNGDLSMFAYAPNATIQMQPNGNLMGGFWGQNVQFQPGGVFFVDTSLQDRWYSNELVLHTRYTVRSR